MKRTIEQVISSSSSDAAVHPSSSSSSSSTLRSSSSINPGGAEKRKKTQPIAASAAPLSLPSFCPNDSIQDLGKLRFACRLLKTLSEQTPMRRLETVYSILNYIPNDQFTNIIQEMDLKSVVLSDYLKTLQRLDDAWEDETKHQVPTLKVVSKTEFFRKVLQNLMKNPDDFAHLALHNIRMFMKKENSTPLYDTLYKLTRSDLDETTRQALIQFYTQYPRLLFLLPCTKILNGGYNVVSKIIEENDAMRITFRELRATIPRVKDYLEHLNKQPSQQ
ncbi:hypothetical protein FDP41_006203 [Naegleria fowleri]|uniref:Uncharacterized protein n=1 Tax=Naegleria fowleri TaxID=5763 RepID=A0A6A5BP76_NAEFO|nr:uncharacterized protein FDP41_006203 [Naegleria fowleri]KAF0974729.1 hypothetical protein FDP41_006203 [Naegleria fowleri]CAG4708114.1 unnamed protein product [Naegleria fowleri]